MNSPPFKQLGKYRIDGLVGQGNMGVVYKAFDVDIARPVALKVLHRHLIDGDSAPEMAQRFKQEAQAAARCLHANIVTVFDYGIAEEAQFIAMEFVQGTNLRTMLKFEKRLPLRQAIDVICQVLSALDYAHENGVIHRDIKPANIMLTHQGRVKVADFGIAKLDSSELTSAGVLIGTPSYMSPEGRLGRPVDAKSDLYAAGLVLYEMLSGMRPMPNQEVLPALRTALSAVVRDSAAQEQLLAVLTRVLSVDPGARLRSAREFIDKLGKIVIPEGDDAGENSLERTLVNIQAQATQPSMDPGTTNLNPIVCFTPATLDPLLKELTHYLGPMAQRVMKRATSHAADVETLIELVAREIPNETERRQFVTRVTKREGTGSGVGTGSEPRAAATAPSSPGSAPGMRLELPEDTLVQVNKLLAEYVGPLATHISRRAVTRSTGWDDLAAQLARQIPNATEQAAFLKRLQAFTPR